MTQDISHFDTTEDNVSVMEAPVSNRRTKALEKPRPARRQELPSRPAAVESEIERIAEEMNELQTRINDLNEIVGTRDMRFFVDETMKEHHLATTALSYAERRLNALRTVLGTLVPSTVSEVQVMQKVAGDFSRYVIECRSTDDDKRLLENLNVAIQDGLVRITGTSRLHEFWSSNNTSPVLRTSAEDVKRLTAALSKLWAAKKSWRSESTDA